MTKNMNICPPTSTSSTDFGVIFHPTQYVQIVIMMQLFWVLPSSIRLSLTQNNEDTGYCSRSASHMTSLLRGKVSSPFSQHHMEMSHWRWPEQSGLLYITQPHHVWFLRIYSGPDFWLCMWSTCFKTADTQRSQPHLDKLTVHSCFTITWI